MSEEVILDAQGERIVVGCRVRLNPDPTVTGSGRLAESRGVVLSISESDVDEEAERPRMIAPQVAVEFGDLTEDQLGSEPQRRDPGWDELTWVCEDLVVLPAREAGVDWSARALDALERAADAVRSGVDALPFVSEAEAALRIECGELPESELQDEQRPCSCSPETLARGGFRGSCPRHGLRSGWTREDWQDDVADTEEERGDA